MKVGTYYSEADANGTIRQEVDGHIVEIHYNTWHEPQEECVTQEINPPTKLSMGEASLHEWLIMRMMEAKALEGAGFYAYDAHGGAVFWKRSTR